MANNPFLVSKPMLCISTKEPFISAGYLYPVNWDDKNPCPWEKRESSPIVRERADHTNKYKAVVYRSEGSPVVVSMGRPGFSMMRANPILRPFKTTVADMSKRVYRKQRPQKKKLLNLL